MTRRHWSRRRETSREPDQLWADFLEARSRVLDTLRIEDAARAGRAWAAFLAAFIESPPIAPEVPK
jgi:hypothetical protein